MGCMSSKLMLGRSLSYSMEGRHQHQHRHLSLRDNEDYSIVDCNRDDQFMLALLSAVHKLSSKDTTHATSSTTLSQQPLPDDTQAEPEEMINAWELMDGLDDDYYDHNKMGSKESLPLPTQEETPVGLIGISGGGGSSRGYRRSKSCGHKLRTSDCDAAQVTIQDKDDDDDDDDDARIKVRCRSFHTVEEYDALMERIAAEKTDMESACDQHPLPRVHLLVDADADNNSAQTHTTISGSSKPSKTTAQGGWKRKNMREELAGSLIIPPPPQPAAAAATIEFTTEASLRQWLNPQASNYETPKFGSYHHHPPHHHHRDKEKKLLIVEQEEEEEERNNIIIIRELVATFEECMLEQQQQAPFIALSD